ncbi:MAG TPA: hypothetical protein VLA93_18425 [Pyrinomonadaceae bacterium]|nr:hypothetical protein [Pyrinomonadaceae bacterium]
MSDMLQLVVELVDEAQKIQLPSQLDASVSRRQAEACRTFA